MQSAFDNLARLLKPGGFVVFSSPWVPEGETAEHFPEMFDCQVIKFRGAFVLLNRTRSGRLEAFDKLKFHNGPGNTLETRLFSIDGLRANCAAAGLKPSIADDHPEYGIVWDECSRGIVLS